MADKPFEVDAAEFIKLLKKLDGESVRKEWRRGAGKAMRIVTRGVAQEAKRAINLSPKKKKGSWAKSRVTGMMTWRRPIYKDVYQFIWKKKRHDIGATGGMIAQKGRPSRVWILRILDQGVKKNRVTRKGQNRGKVRRKSGEGYHFFERGVNATYQKALDQFGVYTVEGLRKLAGG